MTIVEWAHDFILKHSGGQRMLRSSSHLLHSPSRNRCFLRPESILLGYLFVLLWFHQVVKRSTRRAAKQLYKGISGISFLYPSVSGCLNNRVSIFTFLPLLIVLQQQ